jgi:hypothetical protein
MTDAADRPGPPPGTAPRNGLLSRRVPGLLFFLLAAGLALAGWLRPPLSPDLGGLDLPLGTALSADPEQLLTGPRRPLPVSLGTAVLAVIAAGAALTLWRPRCFGVAAGLVLGVTLAAGAAAVLNYPALVEALDREQEQRQHMAAALPARGDVPPLADKNNGRIPGPAPSGWVSAAPAQAAEWGDPSRGWAYLLYPPYLAALAAAGVVLGTGGRLPRRLAHLAAWCVAGALLAGGVCWPRLHAEWHWDRARGLEARADYAAARRELDEAVARFPEFGRMQRSWLLAGKLDYRRGRATAAAQFFRAFQHGRRKEWPQALALLRNLESGTACDRPAASHLAARILVDAGLQDYARDELGAARQRGQQALAQDPGARDARLLLGVVQARVDPYEPARVVACLGPLVLGTPLADLLLRADSLALLGDADFAAGLLKQARRRYAESFDLFTLPRVPNFRASKGLGGL